MTNALHHIRVMTFHFKNIFAKRLTITRRIVLRFVFLLMMIIGASLVLYPLLPLAEYKFHAVLSGDASGTLLPPFNDGPANANVNVNTAQQPGTANTTTARNFPPVGTKDNRILIPKIGVNMPIVEGKTAAALDHGAWRLPQTSVDPHVGNMAISAHRYRFKPPSTETFYLLDQLVNGDTFLLEWNGKEYMYRVQETKVVLPTAMEVLNPTLSPVVTLITCTPLFSTAKRLIVIGALVAT